MLNIGIFLFFIIYLSFQRQTFLYQFLNVSNSYFNFLWFYLFFKSSTKCLVSCLVDFFSFHCFFFILFFECMCNLSILAWLFFSFENENLFKLIFSLFHQLLQIEWLGVHFTFIHLFIVRVVLILICDFLELYCYSACLIGKLLSIFELGYFSILSIQLGKNKLVGTLRKWMQIHQ